MEKNFQPDRFYWLDLIRFLAALICVECHVRHSLLADSCWQDTSWYALLLKYVTHINTQVYAFFILSGFLVGGRTMQRVAEGSFNLKRYAVDRSVRIYLPLLATILFTVIVNGYFGDFFSVGRIIGNILPLQRLFVNPLIVTFWTLPYEIWFYVITGVVAAYFTYNKGKVVSFVLACFCLIVLYCLGLPIFCYWLIGAFAYFLSIKKSRMILLFLIVSILLLEVVRIFPAELFPDNPKMKDGTYYPFMLFVFSFLFSILMKQAIQFKPRTVFSRKIEDAGVRLGRFSYTLYLVHIPILYVMEKIGFPMFMPVITWKFILFWFIETLICVVGSYLFYLCVERNTDKVKMWFYKLLKL